MITKVLQMSDLPQNPKHGQIFKAPEGCVIGRDLLLQLSDSTKVIGTAAHIVGYPDKISLQHCAVARELNVGDEITIKSIGIHYKSMRYLDHYGWANHEEFKERHDIFSITKKIVHHSPGFKHFNVFSYSNIYLS